MCWSTPATDCRLHPRKASCRSPARFPGCRSRAARSVHTVRRPSSLWTPLAYEMSEWTPAIGQRAILRDRRGLQIRRAQVSQRISAWIVVVIVSADKSAEVEYGVVANDTRIRRRNIERLDLRVLIRVADIRQKPDLRSSRRSPRSAHSGCRMHWESGTMSGCSSGPDESNRPG